MTAQRVRRRVSRKERRIISSKLISLLAGIFLLLSLAAMSSAEGQKKPSTKEDRLSGTIHMIDKNTSTAICLGTFNDKTHLVAARVDVRTK